MIDIWYKFIEFCFPFSWTHYVFMKNALLAIILISPVFAQMGTLVVNNRMVFFSDVLAHSTLASLAIGVIFGFQEPSLVMIGFAVLLAIAINFLKKMSNLSMDTVLGILSAFIVALGVVILSRQGGFSKFSTYLIGDILSISTEQLASIIFLWVIVFWFWYKYGNKLILMSVNASLARSRGINIFWLETSFTVLLAIVIMVNIKLVGILIMNSLLVIPAAASRNISRNIKTYTLSAVLISVISGITGLIFSYYWGTASGATIVIFLTLSYVITLIYAKILQSR
ncbi:MAG: metal ABC transporter permease [Candidatus Omnitrophica bacterium]|nr:metal ABC transporter permease [Candidatus Omnitrophota bacterium]